MATPRTLRPNRPAAPVLADREATLDAIARQELLIEGLFARHLFDQPDAHTCATEILRAALTAAFEAGTRARRPGLRPASTARPTVIDGDLVLTGPKPADGCGGWVQGRVGAFCFTAKVYPEHALETCYEIGRSRISKLDLRRLDTGAVAFTWDRGFDTAATDAAAQQAVDRLVMHLANHLYGPAVA